MYFHLFLLYIIFLHLTRRKGLPLGEMKEDYRETYSYGAYISLLTIGTIGNGFIIVYFLKINKKKIQKMTPYHFLLTSLAVIDNLVSIGSPVFHLNRFNWRSNKFICKYFNIFFDMTLPTYSIWILAMISYERYRKMVYPFKASITKSTVLIILVLLFVACTGLYVPLMIGQFSQYLCSGYATGLDTKHITMYLIGNICTDCMIPSVLIVWFYYRISIKVKSFHKIRKNLDNNQQLDNHIRRKVARRTLRTLIAMYILFVYPGRLGFISIICIAFYDPLLYNRHYSVFNTIIGFLNISIYFNNMGNVFIYAWLIVGFRRFLKNIFTFRLLERQTLRRRCSYT